MRMLNLLFVTIPLIFDRKVHSISSEYVSLTSGYNNTWRARNMNKVCIRASSISKDNVLEKSLNNESNSEWDIHVTSPAKINIFLRILRKREDGFHELASLFQAISLSDRLSLRSQSELAKDSMECNMPGVPTDSSNLILKALDVFRKNTGTKEFFHVRLEKNVPMEAGLGGGSANAASALWAINELSGRPATNAQLAEYGAEFGSDISFFFSNGTAYCTVSHASQSIH